MRKYRLEFECLKDGKVSGHGGGECHGLLFSLLEKTCPEYSRCLHEANVNPYSLGPVLGDGRSSRGSFYLFAGKTYCFTIASLTDEMESALASIKPLIHPAHQFRLGAADCRWLSVHKAGEKVYTQLLDNIPPSRFALEFVSPTCFRSQGISLLFPTPELVFGGLQERWNRYAPVSLEILQDLPFVSKYKLNTRLVQFSRYRMTGFIGKVEYSFSKTADPAARQAIGALAQFAQFAGVGYKTGMGMGDIKYSD